MKTFTNSAMRQIKLRRVFLLFFSAALAISGFVYSRYFTNLNFGDEYDNFVYSWLLKEGYLPYRDYFTHHLPAVIFIGAPLEFIAHSQNVYRAFMFFVYFAFFSFFSFYFKGIYRASILLFMLVSSFGISLYGGQQFVDATFVSIFVLSAFFIVLKKNDQPLTNFEIIVFSLLFLLTIFASFVHSIAFLLIVLLHLNNQTGSFKKLVRGNFANLKVFCLVTLSGLLMFLAYLVATGSLNDFYFAAITYNNDYAYYLFYKPYISVKFLDFYLHTSSDVINHFYELTTREGKFFIAFLKSFKFVLAPFLVEGSYLQFLKVTFSELYGNFLSFEIFIALFYITSFVTLFFSRFRRLAVFSLIFIFAIRLRINDRVHMAEYYLFSYWLVSLSIAILLRNVVDRKKFFLSLIGILAISGILGLFVMKNWYDFSQIAFNRFPKTNSQTVNILSGESNADDKLLVIGDWTTAYYYDSKRLPYGYFVNYFPWYDHSEKLRTIWLADLRSYDGKYLIVTQGLNNEYAQNLNNSNYWLLPSFEIIKALYTRIEYPTSDSIFRK